MLYVPDGEMTEAEKVCYDAGWATPLEALTMREALTPRPIATYPRPIQPERILFYWPERGWITGTYYEELEDVPLYSRRTGFRGDGDRVIARSDPTHWMPLPSLPSQDQAAESK